MLIVDRFLCKSVNNCKTKLLLERSNAVYSCLIESTTDKGMYITQVHLILLIIAMRWTNELSWGFNFTVFQEYWWGVTHRNRNDSSTLAPPKPTPALATAQKCRDPRAQCTAWRQLNRLETWPFSRDSVDLILFLETVLVSVFFIAWLVREWLSAAWYVHSWEDQSW